MVAGNKPEAWLKGANLSEVVVGAACFWLSTKLDWKVYLKHKAGWKMVSKGAKPDSEYDAIQAALAKT